MVFIFVSYIYMSQTFSDVSYVSLISLIFLSNHSLIYQISPHDFWVPLNVFIKFCIKSREFFTYFSQNFLLFFLDTFQIEFFVGNLILNNFYLKHFSI